MDDRRRQLLEELLSTPGPSGYEADSQRVWVDYVSEFADEVRTDDYGNAVATLSGTDTEVALAGHGDEIGFIVRDLTDDGFVRLGRIGGSDKTVSRGQHVTIHTADGPVAGVVVGEPSTGSLQVAGRGGRSGVRGGGSRTGFGFCGGHGVLLDLRLLA